MEVPTISERLSNIVEVVVLEAVEKLPDLETGVAIVPEELPESVG